MKRFSSKSLCCILTSLVYQSSTPDPLLHSSLSKTLSTSCDKVLALESQLDQLLREKNETITQLEQRLAESEGQLAGSEEKLRRRVVLLEGGEGAETEVMTLHETVDSLTQQLTSRIVEIEEMERK